MKSPRDQNPASALRLAAEARLNSKSAPSRRLTELELQKLQQELEVHQIELELQLKELRANRAEMEARVERYTDLYDFAPVGYFNLGADGRIRLVNVAGAKLLGIERARLVGRRLESLVAEPDRPSFSDFLRQTFAAANRQSCDVKLLDSDGRQLVVGLEATRSPAGNECRLVMLDISERKLAEQALLEARDYAQTLLATSPTAIITYKASGEAGSANEAAASLIGTTLANLKQQNFRELASWRESKLFAMAELALATRQQQVFENHMVTTFGVESWTACQFVPFHFGGEAHLLLLAKDVTGSKQAEQKLRDSEARYQLAEQATQDGLWDWNILTNTEYFSPRWKEILGLEHEELPGHKSDFLSRVHPEDLAAVDEITREHLATGKRYAGEFRLQHRNGSYRWVHSRGEAVRDEAGRPVRMVGSITDISDRKRAEWALVEAERFLQSTIDALSAHICVLDDQGNILATNQAWDQFAAANAAAAQCVWTGVNYLVVCEAGDGPEPSEARAFAAGIRAVITGLQPDFTMEYACHSPTAPRWFIGRVTRFAQADPVRVVVAHENVTDRKLAELALRRSERALKTLSACDRALVHAASEGELLQEVCQVIIQQGGYRMAWVGFADNHDAGTLRVAAVAGHEAGYLAKAKISWSADNERGQGPTGTAFRTGQTVICQNLQTDPSFSLWRADASHRGYASSISLPLRDTERIIGILMIYAAETNAFQPVEVELLTAMSEDLAYGLKALRTRLQQQEAEVALVVSEAKFRTMFDLSPVPLALNDERQRITLLNQAFVQTYGYTQVDIPTVADWWPKAYPDPRYRQSVVAAWQAEWARMKQTGAPFSPQEITVCCQNGTNKTVLASAAALSGSFAGDDLVILYDITERKRAEEQIKLQISAMTAAANAVVITDRHGKIEWVNPAFTRLTGYSAEEALGGNPRVLQSGEHPPAFYSRMWATVLTGNVWRGELVNKRKDGRLYTEEMTITPVRSEDGQIAHFVAVKQDITERRQMEKRMQQAQKMEAIGQLAGGIAHDFNNMLAAMFGYAHLLQQDTVGNPLAQESVAEILIAANRAKDLVQQILSFSRQREQRPQIVKLETIVKEAIKFLRASMPAHIKIEKELAAETPAVLADPTQIYQVTMNLATNALHAMEDRPGRILVRLDPVQPDEKLIQAHPGLKPILYARLTVADTGHGMDARTLERIFEPFFTTKPIGQGTGLGLAVVHGILESHRGVITVESQMGQGTTFTLYFPAQAQAETLTAAPASAVPHGRGQKILALDDEPALTTVLQRMLRRLDYQVTTSNQASEAIRWVRENPAQFDLVITDLTMPEMNGLDAAEQIRAIRPDLPVILVSGYSVSVDTERLREAGICERLDKPVSPSVLAQVLARVLNQNPRDPQRIEP